MTRLELFGIIGRLHTYLWLRLSFTEEAPD